MPRRRLLKYNEAAAALSVTQSWLRRQVAAETIPFTRLSPKVVRFSERDLDEIVSAARVAVPDNVRPVGPVPPSSAGPGAQDHPLPIPRPKRRRSTQ